MAVDVFNKQHTICIGMGGGDRDIVRAKATYLLYRMLELQPALALQKPCARTLVSCRKFIARSAAGGGASFGGHTAEHMHRTVALLLHLVVGLCGQCDQAADAADAVATGEGSEVASAPTDGCDDSEDTRTCEGIGAGLVVLNVMAPVTGLLNKLFLSSEAVGAPGTGFLPQLQVLFALKKLVPLWLAALVASCFCRDNVVRRAVGIAFASSGGAACLEGIQEACDAAAARAVAKSPASGPVSSPVSSSANGDDSPPAASENAGDCGGHDAGQYLRREVYQGLGTALVPLHIPRPGTLLAGILCQLVQCGAGKAIFGSSLFGQVTEAAGLPHVLGADAVRRQGAASFASLMACGWRCHARWPAMPCAVR